MNKVINKVEIDSKIVQLKKEQGIIYDKMCNINITDKEFNKLDNQYFDYQARIQRLETLKTKAEVL